MIKYLSVFLWAMSFVIIYYYLFDCSNIEYFTETSYLENLLKCNKDCSNNLTKLINDTLQKNPSITFNNFINSFKQDTLEQAILSKISETTFKGLISNFKIKNVLTPEEVRKFIPSV